MGEDDDHHPCRSGFCRDDLISWREENRVHYVLGLTGNERLVATIASDMKAAARKAKRTGAPARVLADFLYLTRKSWSAERRVIGKAEHTNDSADPRFIVTNGADVFASPGFLCETLYCARGDMENRLKECLGDLFADRAPHRRCGSAPALAILARLCADLHGEMYRASRHEASARDQRHDQA